MPFHLRFISVLTKLCVFLLCCICMCNCQPRAPLWLTRNQQKLHVLHCWRRDDNWQGVPAEDPAIPTCKYYILKLFLYCNLNYPIITRCHKAIKITTGSFKAKNKKPIVSLANRQAAEPSLFSYNNGTEQWTPRANHLLIFAPGMASNG